MNNICCFAGHRKIYNAEYIFKKVTNLAEKLILERNISEFRVGNYGEFDSLCARAIRKIKEKYPEVKLTLVIPYLTNEINEYKEFYHKNYDSILLADISQNTPRRLRIIKANQYMVESSRFLICYIDHEWGGAAQTLECAKTRKNIKIFNLADR